MQTRMLQLAVAALAAPGLVAMAQQPSRSMPMKSQSAMECPMGMHGMMMGGMMSGGMMRPGQGRMSGMSGSRTGAMMSDSSMMMQMRSELGLTDAQMQQLRTTEQRACAAAQPHMKLAMQAHQAAMQALEGDNPSLDHFEDQLDKAAKHMVEAQVAMAKGMIEFRKSLSPSQRQKLDQMHQQMMRGEMGQERR